MSDQQTRSVDDRWVDVMRAWGERHGLEGEEYTRRVMEASRLINEAMTFGEVTGERRISVSDPLLAELLIELQAVV